jgi:hypothetical protein
MLVRLWLFTPRSGYYPEGGTYDTSVIDVDTGNCGDPEQFVTFQDLLQYANDRGEELQQVSSADEAYALCSRQRIMQSTQPCGGGVTNNTSTLSTTISRPIGTCNVPYYGGGSRTTPPLPIQCPPVPPLDEPIISSQPVVTTRSDQAARIIALARKNSIVPTVVY